MWNAHIEKFARTTRENK